MKFKKWQICYDKTKRRKCEIIGIETHDRLQFEWYVVKYRDGSVRNCYDRELKEIAASKGE